MHRNRRVSIVAKILLALTLGLVVSLLTADAAVAKVLPVTSVHVVTRDPIAGRPIQVVVPIRCARSRHG